MEQKPKCSSKKHKDIEASIFCKDCKIYLCNNCQSFHSDLFENHKLIDIKNTNPGQNYLFTGFCPENDHFEKLEYFCKNHNNLCCSSCIVKVIKKGKGLHSNCEICLIEDIKDKQK